MRKIAFIGSNEGYRWGGSEECWSLAAARLTRRGVSVSVSVRAWEPPVRQIEDLRSVGCRILVRKPQSLLARLGRRFARRDYVREHVRKLGEGTDLIVISQGSNQEGLQWMEASRANGYRYAVISQAASELWWPADDLAERLAACYEHASGAYFVSEANLELSRRQFGTKLSHGRVIRNPFNVRYNVRPPWPDDSEGLALACVGRLEIAAKGQDLLIAVLSREHWRHRRVRVSLYGSGKNERGLRRLVNASGLTNVSFMGFVSDIESIWGRNHALVLPSRYEGLPLAIVEAMLCGRSCIVTDVAGNTELVRDSVNGFVASAPAIELLDEAMNRAWENRGRLKEMGSTAAIDVRKLIPPDPIGDFVFELTSLAVSSNGACPD